MTNINTNAAWPLTNTRNFARLNLQNFTLPGFTLSGSTLRSLGSLKLDQAKLFVKVKLRDCLVKKKILHELFKPYLFATTSAFCAR